MLYVWAGLGLLIILFIYLYIDFKLGRKKHIATSTHREYPVRSNSNLEIFTHGPDLFADLFKEISNAKYQVHVSFYIAKNDQISQEFFALLKKKALQGLDVRLLVDWLSSHNITKEIETELHGANVQYRRSNVPKLPFLFYSFNIRNHRKITVIDGKTAYVGGYNIGKEYIDKDPKLSPWRDYHLKINGDTVFDLHREFQQDWASTSKALQRIYNQKQPAISLLSRKNRPKVGFAYNTEFASETTRIIPKNKTKLTDQAQASKQQPELATVAAIPTANLTFGKKTPKPMPIKIVSSDGVLLEDTFAERIRNSKKSIFIGTPYFIPSNRLMTELIAAARHGVQITILVPEIADHFLVKEASYHYLRQLLAEGATVYQFQNGFYHAKVFLFDDELADIGTANFDQRSLFLNHEINCYIYDESAIAQIKAIIQKDLKDSKQLTLTQLNKVNLLTKTKEKIAQPLTRFL